MDKELLTKSALLSTVAKRNRVQLVLGIVFLTVGIVWATFGAVLVFSSASIYAFLCLPLFSLPLIAGIILLSTRKNKRASAIENGTYDILQLPVIEKEEDTSGDVISYWFLFPGGYRHDVSMRDYEATPLGEMYYFIVFDEKDYLGYGYATKKYQLSEELLSRVKTNV